MNIIEQLRRDEGVRNFPYTDTVGKLTIGVGRNLSDVGLSDNEVDYLLQNDLDRVSKQLEARLPWFATLDPVRQAVLMNMAFNLGTEELMMFHQTLAYVEAHNWNDAASEMLNSKWAAQVGQRAIRLSEQMRTGEWT